MKGARSVDEYLEGLDAWGDELERLREILRGTELDETVKWGAPCYTFAGKPVVGMAAFKSYFALWFHQGALLADPHGVLISAQEGRTKALRQWRFASKKEIAARRIQSYVKEAVERARAGERVPIDRSKPLILPVELKQALAASPEIEAAFAALTPGRRREYADHVAEAKRDATRQKRVEKILPMIAAGVGLHDRYRNC
ncbi:MAG: YdeI/OmpD-associated family protein [Planctomycetes bacterium]|nr:YdeI/OmpD-associated family protein [Planctomycetota bacterium]